MSAPTPSGSPLADRRRAGRAESDFDQLKRRVLLAEKARDVVRSATLGSGRPGARWHLSDLGYPRTVGGESLAMVLPAADGHGYVVGLYTFGGDEISSCVRQTLRGAFAAGERLVACKPRQRSHALAVSVEKGE